MKGKIYFITFIILLLSCNVYAESIECTPEHVTFASNGGSVFTVEKTTVNWDRIVYQINDDNTATASTFKNPNHATTKINPSQTDEMIVLENSPDRIVLMQKKVSDMMHLTVDVLFPKDGNGYSFYVSDYPKTRMPGKSELVNLSKLYMLNCQCNQKSDE